MAWTLDPAHTHIGFSAKHLGVATVRGRFGKFDAQIELDSNGDPTTASGRVEIDVASIDTGQEQRDGHLRGADFFDVEKFPKLVFEAKGIAKRGDGDYQVTGDLTIRGVTKPISLDYEHNGVVDDPMGNTKVGGTLTGTINRSDWGLTWNAPLGNSGLLVSDKIKLEIDGELVQVKEPAAAGTSA